MPLNKHSFSTEREFKNFSRGFNIDLAPKILFSKSESVEHCIESGVGNYLEFQNVKDNFVMVGGDFIQIPFSKSEVFSNTSLSLLEKN